MLLTAEDLQNMDRITRLNLVNSCTGIKPANLIGTINAEAKTNLAIFSSVIHLGSHPPLLGMIVRPAAAIARHTYENIRARGWYTINHVKIEHISAAHQTSAKYPADISEFVACGFTEEFLKGCPAPFVKESSFRMALELKEEIFIPVNGTILLIGEIRLLDVPEASMQAEGHCNLEIAGTAGISGLNSYYSLQLIDTFPYARPEPAYEKKNTEGEPAR